MNRIVALTILFSMSCAGDIHAEPPKLLEVKLRQGTVLGMPVHWGSVDAAVLETSGKLHLFDLDQVQSHRLLESNFQPQSLVEARARLQAELGGTFETRVAGPYVIAAPVGEASRWQSRFLSLLSGYTRHFELRGWSLRQPDFPLIVIVFSSREEFLRYARSQVGPLPSQTVGSYFPESNRCILYQIPGYRGTNWTETEATIVHESVHQLAYNTGVHERLFQNPLWFVEGLATMFEVPAVYDLGVHRGSFLDRMHTQKLAMIQPSLRDSGRLEREIHGLLESDQLFQSQPHLAYSLAWAMTFYLAERMPVEFQELIDAQHRRPFGDYTAQQRMDDFQSTCRMDARTLSSRMAHFFQQ